MITEEEIALLDLCFNNFTDLKSHRQYSKDYGYDRLCSNKTLFTTVGGWATKYSPVTYDLQCIISRHSSINTLREYQTYLKTISISG